MEWPLKDKTVWEGMADDRGRSSERKLFEGDSKARACPNKTKLGSVVRLSRAFIEGSIGFGERLFLHRCERHVRIRRRHQVADGGLVLASALREPLLDMLARCRSQA